MITFHFFISSLDMLSQRPGGNNFYYLQCAKFTAGTFFLCVCRKANQKYKCQNYTSIKQDTQTGKSATAPFNLRSSRPSYSSFEHRNHFLLCRFPSSACGLTY